MMLNIFSYTHLPTVYLLSESVCLDLSPASLIRLFVFLLLSFKSSLCIWNISSLSDVYSENNFSQSVPHLFILLTVHWWSRDINFNAVYLTRFSLMDHTFLFFHSWASHRLTHPDVLSSWDWLHLSLVERVNKLIYPQPKAFFFFFSSRLF